MLLAHLSTLLAESRPNKNLRPFLRCLKSDCGPLRYYYLAASAL